MIALKKQHIMWQKFILVEFFSGLNLKKEPEIKLFENKIYCNEMLIEKVITLFSNCEDHFVPIIIKVHFAYISSGQVIGLSKINQLHEASVKKRD